LGCFLQNNNNYQNKFHRANRKSFDESGYFRNTKFQNSGGMRNNLEKPATERNYSDKSTMDRNNPEKFSNGPYNSQEKFANGSHNPHYKNNSFGNVPRPLITAHKPAAYSHPNDPKRPHPHGQFKNVSHRGHVDNFNHPNRINSHGENLQNRDFAIQKNNIYRRSTHSASEPPVDATSVELQAHPKLSVDSPHFPDSFILSHSPGDCSTSKSSTSKSPKQKSPEINVNQNWSSTTNEDTRDSLIKHDQKETSTTSISPSKGTETQITPDITSESEENEMKNKKFEFNPHAIAFTPKPKDKDIVSNVVAIAQTTPAVCIEPTTVLAAPQQIMHPFSGMPIQMGATPGIISAPLTHNLPPTNISYNTAIINYQNQPNFIQTGAHFNGIPPVPVYQYSNSNTTAAAIALPLHQQQTQQQYYITTQQINTPSTQVVSASQTYVHRTGSRMGTPNGGTGTTQPMISIDGVRNQIIPSNNIVTTAGISLNNPPPNTQSSAPMGFPHIITAAHNQQPPIVVSMSGPTITNNVYPPIYQQFSQQAIASHVHPPPYQQYNQPTIAAAHAHPPLYPQQYNQPSIPGHTHPPFYQQFVPVCGHLAFGEYATYTYDKNYR